MYISIQMADNGYSVQLPGKNLVFSNMEEVLSFFKKNETNFLSYYKEMSQTGPSLCAPTPPNNIKPLKLDL